jgi:hypothetical protein
VKWLNYHKFSSFFLKLFEKYKQACIYVVCLFWRNPLQINFEKKKILYSNLFFSAEKNGKEFKNMPVDILTYVTKASKSFNVFFWNFVSS